ncbi:MAG: DUF11 domain-containing protein, partial [Pirellulaceae bacterium]|nr:DUF11 domain-containing protein [Pirellulaceae bacterium]
FLDLLKRTQALGKQVNLRLAIVAVVLGVGGFAVYKGVQQLGPSKPTPKKVVKAGEENSPGTPGAGAPEAGAPGAVEGQLTSAEAPLYGGDAVTEEKSPAQYGAETETSVSAPVYGTGENPAEQIDQEIPAEERRSAPNRLRSPTRLGGSGGYALSDENQGADQPAVSEDNSPAGEGPLVQEVPSAEAPENAEEPAALTPLPSTRPPARIGAARSNPLPSSRPFSGASANAEAADSETTAELQPVRPNPYGPKAGSASSTAHDRGSRHVAAPVSHALTASNGVPGERQLEGMQAPSVALEKLAPAEVQVGKLATFETRIRNVGQIAAHEVIVTDHVPRGTRLEATTPQATEAADGTLTWNLGTMQPGDEIAISLQVTPEEEGEIGSVAQVGFAGKATARTISTRPLLKIEHTAPKQVMIGQEVRLGVTITNPGSGAATGVIVEEDVPDGLSHVAGNELEFEIGVLRPGETRELELTLKAEKPGVLENTILVRGEGNLTSEHRVQIEVISPQLQVGVSGPKTKYLDRQATYSVTVANPGTAAARDVQIIAYLPKGMKYVSSDSEGQYDAGQNAVLWGLEELPAAKSGTVKFVATPVETGEQKIRVEGKADLGLSVASEQTVQVEAASLLVFSISDLNGPIEVDTDTTYEVRVSNKGSKPATNVVLAAALPNEIKLVSGEGPSRATTRGQQIGFAPIGRINSGEEVVFRIHAQGLRDGDHLVRVQLSSNESSTPVTQEVSTRVYVDR